MTLTGDVAVFWGVIVADYEVCYVGSQIIFVYAAEVDNLLGDVGLYMSVCRLIEDKFIERFIERFIEGRLTRGFLLDSRGGWLCSILQFL